MKNGIPKLEIFSSLRIAFLSTTPLVSKTKIKYYTEPNMKKPIGEPRVLV